MKLRKEYLNTVTYNTPILFRIKYWTVWYIFYVNIHGSYKLSKTVRFFGPPCTINSLARQPCDKRIKHLTATKRSKLFDWQQWLQRRQYAATTMKGVKNRDVAALADWRTPAITLDRDRYPRFRWFRSCILKSHCLPNMACGRFWLSSVQRRARSVLTIDDDEEEEEDTVDGRR